MTEQLLQLISSNKIENLSIILKELNIIFKVDISSINLNNKINENFFIIFLLLNRIFGEETTGCVNITLTDVWIKGKIGGWLKEVAGIKAPNYGKSQLIIESPTLTGFSPSLLQRDYGLSMDAIHIMNLFSADPNSDRSLLKVMSGLNRYDEINLSLFPQKIQWKFLGRPEYDYVQTINHSLYDSWYAGLRVDQYREGYSQPILSPDLFSYYLICFLRYPTIENVFLTYSYGTPGSTAENAAFEHFFSSTTFAKVNKIFSNDSEISLVKIYTTCGENGWMKGSPYLVLLKHYLDTFLPIINQSKNNLTQQQQQQQQQHIISSEDNVGNLFLRLIIDFWIDTNCIVRNQTEQYFRFQSKNNSSPQSKQVSYQSITLNSEILKNNIYNPIDVHFLNTSFNTLPTRHTLQCIFLVVSHLLTEITPNNPLSYPILLLQQPIYDLFRSIFICDNVDKTVFFLTIQLWHLWITPWKSQLKSRKSKSNGDTGIVENALRAVSVDVNQLKNDYGSKYYIEIWRPYISSHFHFYTTLLVLFFKGISIKNFLTNINGLNALESTLQIYTTNLVGAIDALSVGYLAQLNRTISLDLSEYIHPNIERTTREAFINNTILPLSNYEFDSIISQHRNLYPSDPNVTSAIVNYRKESYEFGKNIIQILQTLSETPKGLEDNFLKILIGNLLSPLFGGQDGRDPRFSVLKDMSNRIRQLIQFFEKVDSILQISSPQTSNKSDVMVRPLRNNEIVWLAKLLVFVSRLFNEYYDLPSDKSTTILTWNEVFSRSSTGFKFYLNAIKSSFRFNLRFLANTTCVWLFVWFQIFGIYSFLNLSEVWIAFFTSAISIPLLMSLLQDTVEIGPFETSKDSYTQLNYNHKHHGTLNEITRKEILNGTKTSDKINIPFSDDVINKPLRSDELHVLVKYLIYISKKLNSSYNLPKDKNTVYYTWKELFLNYKYENDSTIKNNTVYLYFKLIQNSFRFNLRSFGQLNISLVFILRLVMNGSFSGIVPGQ